MAHRLELNRQALATGTSFVELRNFAFGANDGTLPTPGGKLWSIASWCLRARRQA
jgi:hypothetical protein